MTAKDTKNNKHFKNLFLAVMLLKVAIISGLSSLKQFTKGLPGHRMPIGTRRDNV